MKTLKVLLEERASLIEQQNTIVQTAQGEQREMNTDEETRFDDLQTQIEAFDPKIKRAKQVEERQKQQSAAGENVNAPAVHTSKKEDRTFSLTGAIRSVVNGEGLSGLATEVRQEAEKELRDSGLEIPSGAKIAIPSSMMENRDQSVTVDSGLKGGKLVVTEAPRMVAPLFPNNPLADLGITSLTGLKGNVPLLSNTDVTFTWADETENITATTDANFDGPTLKPKRVVAVVDISNQLVLQSSINVEAFVINLLNDAYGRTLAGAVLNGAGGKAPLGILNLTGVNDAAMATAAAPDYAKVVQLETMIEAANATEKSLAYVTTKALKGKLKTTPKAASTDSIMLSDGKMLNGSKLVSTNLLPELTGNHPLIYGDWSQVFTGSWGGVSITVDPYTQQTAGKIRLVVNAYADVQVVHPKAFAFNKKFTV